MRVLGVLRMLRVLRMVRVFGVFGVFRMRRPVSRRGGCLGRGFARHADAASAVDFGRLVQIPQQAERVYFVGTFHRNPLTVVTGGAPHVVVSVSGGGRANGGRGERHPNGWRPPTGTSRALRRYDVTVPKSMAGCQSFLLTRTGKLVTFSVLTRYPQGASDGC
jgi:hypothetical protein